MNEFVFCPVCGEKAFSYQEVLWDKLVEEWDLSEFEKDYINRQQGYCCKSCGNNLRSMALAYAILKSYSFEGTLEQFVELDFSKDLKVLEINEAGGLTKVLNKLPLHQIICYPEIDMTKMHFERETFDLIVHSDTLEHIPDPVVALSECRRVLKKDGYCIYTVPIVVGRLTRSRVGMKKSYHGNSNYAENDYIVHSEFGADMWKFAIEAGFSSVQIRSLEYPAGLALEVRK